MSFDRGRMQVRPFHQQMHLAGLWGLHSPARGAKGKRGRHDRVAAAIVRSRSQQDHASGFQALKRVDLSSHAEKSRASVRTAPARRRSSASSAA